MRLKILKGGIFFGLSLLAVGLFDIQVLKAGYYRNLSENNRIRLIPLEAPRGRVMDRAGRIFATTRPSYNLIATPEDITPEIYPRLAKLLHVTEKTIRERMSAEREYSFSPVVLAADIPKELLFQIEELHPELPGISIQTDWIRSYPNGSVASHVIGYLGKINEQEYKALGRDQFGMNALMGRTGIEKIFDLKLRGWRGAQEVEVNARGEKLRVVDEKPAVPGEDVVLALDLEFQKRLTQLVKGKRATLAFLDLKTNELMALVSSPDFDPNVFVSPRGNEARVHFLEDSNAPLLDRGASSTYPPGSVFKLVTALAGLESGKITPHTTFTCPGYFQLKPGSRHFHCWFDRGHGALDLYRALERSCNVYFYNVGRLVGADALARTARELGFGQTFQMELTNLAPGLVPDAAWKQEHLKQRWYPGETLSYAVGQGYLLVSPLQVLRLSAMIAKDGEWVEPRLVRDPQAAAAAAPRRIAIKPENLKVIRQGMLKVVESNYGTGQLARVDFDQLAAKTGTAQAPPKSPHAWITGFFPYRDPQVAFVAMIEHGGSGGIEGARVIKQALQIWRELSGYYDHPMA